MFNSAGEVLLEKEVQVHFHFFSGTGFHSVQVQLPPLLAVQHTALHQLQANLVVLETPRLRS